MKDHLKINAEYFKDRVNYYFFDVFRLFEYELEIDEQEDDDARSSIYWHKMKVGAQMVTICYTRNWLCNLETTKKEIDKVAFHEVCEALLSELGEMAHERYISEREITASTHRIIRRLENIILPLVKNKRSQHELRT